MSSMIPEIADKKSLVERYLSGEFSHWSRPILNLIISTLKCEPERILHDHDSIIDNFLNLGREIINNSTLKTVKWVKEFNENRRVNPDQYLSQFTLNIVEIKLLAPLISQSHDKLNAKSTFLTNCCEILMIFQDRLSTNQVLLMLKMYNLYDDFIEFINILYRLVTK